MNKTLTDLLPCPFCGGTNCTISTTTIGKWKFVYCPDCLAEGPADDMEVVAIADWNRRAHPGHLEPRAEVTEEQPSLTNPLTPYGMLVRALRIVAGVTLMDMTTALLTTPAKLSAMEFGRAPVTPEFAFDVAAYFDALDVPHTASALRAAIAARAGEGQ
ncbi:Lar family restriction alleviation protein [Burkholderia sp. BCC0398]|uniref:Lar family restriction alleviation protein n=1 Tax=Burkholderia sp. BCC0398 TaxID=2676297 RepID=UPI00158A2FD2|nr:Lar family restriction alleviation protein [Burkholderia sp. BCC0398]